MNSSRQMLSNYEKKEKYSSIKKKNNEFDFKIYPDVRPVKKEETEEKYWYHMIWYHKILVIYDHIKQICKKNFFPDSVYHEIFQFF